jgi:HpcH/HpaI aldolase/citrate lyase family
MLDLLQFTNDPVLARRCDALDGLRLVVDLERLGKAERQAGRNTFISAHTLEDVGRIKSELRRARLMVRVNPLHPGTPAEVDDAIAQGADLLMLPMFTDAATLREFARTVDGRCPLVPLVETAGALDSVHEWVETAGVWEVFVGLNDLHISMGLRFMFEPLALGRLEEIARAARTRGLRFGFGGIARLDEGLLPGRAVLGEHLRLGSQAVILSRTFHRPDAEVSFEASVQALREAERELAVRDADRVHADARETADRIRQIAADMAAA